MRRLRLTITLRNDLVKQLDQLIDGSKLRNRSHAIEYMLGRSLLPASTRALILAGGQGLKLRPLTYELPKTLIPVHNRPLIEHILRQLAAADLREVVCSIGYLGSKVKINVGDGSRLGVHINYVEQKPGADGTALAVRSAQAALVGSGTVLIWYGDVLAELAIPDLLAFHEQQGTAATVAITSSATPSEWGVITMSGSRVTGFTEKPGTGSRSHLIFSGVAVVNTDVLSRVTPTMRSLERELFPVLAAEEDLAGYMFDGAWFDISTPGTYERALKEWPNGN